MKKAVPKIGMILAAGFGARLQSVSQGKPKPLIELRDGVTALDIAIKTFFEMEQIEKVIVNTHYKGEQIKEHLLKYSKKPILISEEKEILDTGGGILKAMNDFESSPYVIRNSDVIFIDKDNNVFDIMLNAWDEEKMDALLLMIPKEKAKRKEGDFSMSFDGKVMRNSENNNFVYTGAAIISPKFFSNKKVTKFSIREILFNSSKEQPLNFFGIVIPEKTVWYDFGTPENLYEARKCVMHNH